MERQKAVLGLGDLLPTLPFIPGNVGESETQLYERQFLTKRTGSIRRLLLGVLKIEKNSISLVNFPLYNEVAEEHLDSAFYFYVHFSIEISH